MLDHRLTVVPFPEKVRSLRKSGVFRIGSRAAVEQEVTGSEGGETILIVACCRKEWSAV